MRSLAVNRPGSSSLNISGSPVPAGTVIRLKFDANLFEVPTATLDGAPLVAISGTSAGVTTVDYTVNFALEIGPDGYTSFELEFSAIADEDRNRPWPEGDVTATTLEVIPAPGSVPGSTGATEQWEPQFADTHDLAVSEPQYTDYTVRDWNGATRTVQLITGVTLTNLGAGELPADWPSNVGLFFTPELVIGEETPPNGSALVTNIRATRNGVSAIEEIPTPSFWNQVYFTVDTRSLQQGEKIVVAWDLNVETNGRLLGAGSDVSVTAPGFNENPVTSDNNEVRHYVDFR